MKVQPELQALIRLQSVDDKIAAVQKDLKNIPSRIEAENEYLREFEDAVKSAEAELETIQKRQRETEGEIQMTEEKLRETRGKQTLVKTNEEYRALTHEIETFQAKITELEDRVLECMEGLEPVRKELAEAKSGLERAQKHVQVSVGQHKDKQARLEHELEKLQRERQEAWADVSADWQTRYNMLHKGKNGTAVSPIIDRTCQACRMSETIQRTFEIRDAQDEIFSCSNCGRIVYYQEAEVAESVPPADDAI